MRFLIIFSIIFIIAFPASASELTVITEYNPPFNYSEGEHVRGISTDIFLEMAQKAGVDITRKDIKLWPWARGYEYIKQNPNVVLFSTGRTAEREKQFQWIGPIMILETQVVVRRNTKIDTSDLKKATAQYRFGTVRGSAPEEYAIKKGCDLSDLHRVNHMRLNIKKLLDRRIDAIFALKPCLLHEAKTMGISPEMFIFKEKLFDGRIYFATSHKMPACMVGKLRAAFNALTEDGTVDDIIARYQ